MADYYNYKLIPAKQLSYAGTFALVLFGIFFGIAILQLVHAPLKWFIAVLLAVLLGYVFFSIAILSGKSRSVLLFLLTFSVPIGLNYHITHRPGHIGVADGLTIELIDIWLILIIIIWLYDITFHKKNTFKLFPSLTLPFMVIIVTGFLSVFNSRDVSLSFYGIAAFTREFIFLILVANSIRSKNDLSVTLLGLNMSTLIISIICILEVILEINIKIIPREHDVEAYNLTVFRASGLSTPTYTGAFLATILPLMFVQFFHTKKTIGKLFFIVATLIGLTALVLTLTRGAWISLFAALFPLTFFLYRYRFIKFRNIVFLLLAILSLFLFFQDRVFNRLSEGFGNVTARIALLETASNMIAEHPISGIGVNTYTIEMNRYSPEIEKHSFKYLVHNKYILLWSEMGFFALFAFLWLMANSVKGAIKLIYTPDDYIMLAAFGLLSSVTVVMINMNVESYDSGPPIFLYWLLIGMIAGLGRTYR